MINVRSHRGFNNPAHFDNNRENTGELEGHPIDSHYYGVSGRLAGLNLRKARTTRSGQFTKTSALSLGHTQRTGSSGKLIQLGTVLHFLYSWVFATTWIAKCHPDFLSTSLHERATKMYFTSVLLGLAALGHTKPLGLENGLGKDQFERSSVSSEDSEAFRLRSRDLLRQGFKLAVHDVEASTAPAMDKGT